MELGNKDFPPSIFGMHSFAYFKYNKTELFTDQETSWNIRNKSEDKVEDTVRSISAKVVALMEAAGSLPKDVKAAVWL